MCKIKRPNILVFMTDQQRGDSIYKAKMPNLARFRREAITFTNARTVAPHCCPSRASFFTGMYPSQHGIWNNVKYNNALSTGFYDGVRLFSEDLKDSGYRMYFSGKWHASEVEGPLDRGFDEFFEPILRPGKRCMYMIGDVKKQPYSHTRPATTDWNLYNGFVQRCVEQREQGEIIRNGYPSYKICGVDEDIFQDEDVINAAISGLKDLSKTKEPWFYYIGTLGPHDPYYAPQEFLDMYDINKIVLPDNYYDRLLDKPNLYRRTRDRFDQLSEQEHKEAIRHYLACCTYQDALFGRILRVLDEQDGIDDVMVIFMSDHGDYTAEHGLWAKGVPCFDGAYRIPTVIRWPNGIEKPGRIVDSFISIADFAPTFTEIARCSNARKYAGRSLLPLLKNTTADARENIHYTQTNGNELYAIQRSVRTLNWKYVYNGFDYDELYNLKTDPGETINLIDNYEYRPIVKELCKKMWRFLKSIDDTCVHPYVATGLSTYGPGVIYDNSI